MLQRLVGLAAACLAITAPSLAQSTPFEARYDASIPSIEDFAGYETGAEITAPEVAVNYIRALAEAAPERMQVFDYATSWQGRDLVYGVIASPDRIADLDAIRADIQRLADPRDLSTAEREALIAEMPAVVWLSYGVHGNEISTTDAGLWAAYHLLAAQDDPMVESIFENAIIVVDPTQNPDGRARFIANFQSNRGLVADENRYSAEHDEPWPSGRVNHYLFDMNRDWFARTQPETRGRVDAMLEWRPMVVVDSHEMSGDSTYFFAPAAEPFNPNIAASQRAAQELIGRNNGRWFDRLGYPFFTREVYDAFYPGYGDMWPTLQGAIAMTYEQASPRGLLLRKRDGSIMTYRDAVDHNFIASLSTAQAVAENRERFLRNYIDYRLTAGSAGPDQAILLDAGSNRWNVHRMARNLAAQGIEIGYTSSSVSACGASFEDGAYLVRFDQPAGRLARTLLEATTALPADFVVEQEDRRERGLGHELYDVTAWSLPLMANVNHAICRRAPNLSTSTVDPASPLPAGGGNGDATFGYVIPWTDAGQARFVAALTREGIAMRSTDEAFRIGDTVYPRGSVVVRRHGAAPDLDFTIERLARESGAVVDGMANSWVDDGPNPGSSAFRPVRAPRIALVWGQSTSPLSAGATRYVLEQRYNIPVSVIRASTMGYADLSFYDVVILPESRGSYSSTLGASGASNLEEFVDEGGVLVGLGSAMRWMSHPDRDFLPARREFAAGTPRPSGGEDGAFVEGRVISSVEELEELMGERGAMPDSSPGALVRVDANTDAWMSAGYDGGATALATGSDIYAPISMNDATTALSFGARDGLVQGGYLWEEYTDQLAHKPFVITRSHGDGQVVGFTQSPTTRAYLDGLDLLLLNAVLLGPAQSRALR